jgi:exonuclease SbcD
MKIIHTADIHFSNKKDIYKDVLKCSNYLLDTAEEEKPDMIIMAGDIFDERVALDSSAALSAVDFITRAGQIAPVLVLKGTPTHDVGDSLHIFRKLNTSYPVYVSEDIEQICLKGASFRQPLIGAAFIPLEAGVDGCSAVLSCLPSIQKGNLLALKGKGQDIQDGDYEIADLLRDIFQGFGLTNQEARRHEIPTIFVGHGSILGASLSTGQQMIGKDIELGISDLRLAHADLYCLGHIHKAQRWNEIFYSGSITRLNYGEEEDKGFFIHELLEGKAMSRFIHTPARIMKTIRCDDSLPSVESLADNINDASIKGASLKITYQVSEEDVHRVNDEELKSTAIEKYGVKEVKIEKTITPKVRVRAEGISRIQALDEKLRRWGETVGQDIPQGAFSKLESLERMDEQEIIKSYDASESASVSGKEKEDEAALFKA